MIQQPPKATAFVAELWTKELTSSPRANQTKREMNTVWIYPPRAERAAALASADPERVTAL